MKTNRVRGPNTPRDRLPELPEIRARDREDIRMEVPPEVRARDREDIRMEVPTELGAPAPKDRPPSGSQPGGHTERQGLSSRELLRRTLSSPRSARQGFLLREALGPPVSLRADSHDRPS